MPSTARSLRFLLLLVAMLASSRLQPSLVIQNMEGVGSKAGLNSYIFGKTAGMLRGDVYLILAASLFLLGTNSLSPLSLTKKLAP